MHNTWSTHYHPPTHILFDILGRRTIANVMKPMTSHVFSLIQSDYYSALIYRGKIPLLGIK